MTILFWAVSILTAYKAYFDIRADKPHWEGRAELFTGLVMMAVAGVVGAGILICTPYNG